MSHLKNHIQELEDILLHHDFSDNKALLNEMLGDDFAEIGSTGKISARDEVIHWLISKNPKTRWVFTDFRIQELAPDLVLAMYQANIKETQNIQSNGSIRSSIWKRYDQHWKLIFHQGTRIL